MASGFTTFVTKDEFNLFHKIDRALYAILVLTLHRDPVESMQVIALFIWLERKGFGFLVDKILSFPHLLVNELAREAVKCLDYTKNIKMQNLAPSSSQTPDLFPLMKSTLHQDLTLHFFRDTHHRLLKGVATIIDTVCVRALSDIMNIAIERNRSMNTPAAMYPAMWQFGQSVHPDDRTLFITFSKGYPVSEWEVREFFTGIYGDCVESIYMQDVKEKDEQCLFARIVFRSFAMIGLILDTNAKTKFCINGKHAWVRKFIPKRARHANLR